MITSTAATKNNVSFSIEEIDNVIKVLESLKSGINKKSSRKCNYDAFHFYDGYDKRKEVFSKRLIIAMNENQLSVRKLKEQINKIKHEENISIGMAENTIYRYAEGKTVPNYDRLCLLAKALNVTNTWLAGYNGKKYVKSKVSQNKA